MRNFFFWFFIFLFSISVNVLIKLEMPKPELQATLHSTVNWCHCLLPFREARSTLHFIYMNDTHLEKGLKRNELALHHKKTLQKQILHISKFT